MKLGNMPIDKSVKRWEKTVRNGKQRAEHRDLAKQPGKNLLKTKNNGNI